MKKICPFIFVINTGHSNIIQGLIFEIKLLSLNAQRANAIKSSNYVFLIIFLVRNESHIKCKKHTFLLKK